MIFSNLFQVCFLLTCSILPGPEGSRTFLLQSLHSIPLPNFKVKFLEHCMHLTIFNNCSVSKILNSLSETLYPSNLQILSLILLLSLAVNTPPSHPLHLYLPLPSHITSDLRTFIYLHASFCGWLCLPVY